MTNKEAIDIPKKPISLNGYLKRGCPNCGNGFDYDSYNSNHCPNCGQAIDWSYEEEEEEEEE